MFNKRERVFKKTVLNPIQKRHIDIKQGVAFVNNNVADLFFFKI